MKLKYVSICGFRGYINPVHIAVAESFTVIDGRNGVGKSTMFDAIEFALTGELSKYNHAKASGQTVADYIWWTGDGGVPVDRYVEVGFHDDEVEIAIRRTQLSGPDADTLQKLTARLCDASLAPSSPLVQLCTSTIIRDEHITSLSLDLKETERYTLLRDALGANDAEAWISRGAKLASLSAARLRTAQHEVTIANSEVAASGRRLDEVRARVIGESVVAEAAERLRAFAATSAPADQLISPVRQALSGATADIDALNRVVSRWSSVQQEKKQMATFETAIDLVRRQQKLALSKLDSAISALAKQTSSSELNARARSLLTLVEVGRKLGLSDGHCPLCDAGRTHDEFEHALKSADALASQLDFAAATAMQLEQAKADAEARLAEARQLALTAETARDQLRKSVDTFYEQIRALGFDQDTDVGAISKRAVELTGIVEAAQKDLRIIETLRLNIELERAMRAELDASSRLAKAQQLLGRARKADAAAQALHDAARRASSETLDRRLERVLPLLSEIYQRLRPHPVWSNIEYSIRGDVRRFMTLRVGEELNPQFLFSSGQRRATGLAFLLAVNLSLAWSRWRTILLDDPVQHVDDFRTVHLAEVLAQLVGEGRQIICAVEDAALADLLCRRLPVSRASVAKRVTLGPDSHGALSVVSERDLQPLPAHTITSESEHRVAS